MARSFGRKRRNLVGYEYRQVGAQAEWLIEHQLGRNPAVSVTNEAGEQVLAKVEHLSDYVVKVSFTEAMAGSAILN